MFKIHTQKYKIFKMSEVTISQKNMKLAKKSLQRLYVIEFGEESLSSKEKTFTRNELISRYVSNLKFWNNQLPETKPGMNEFTFAKHAICSNAIQQLWNKVDEYFIRKEVENLIN